MPERGPEPPTWRDRLRHGVDRLRTRVPPGLRTVLGLLLMVGGVFGMLPILGFWMLPLGATLIWFDVRAIWHWFRRG
ncbi:hypothetical protein OB2597_02092 [Pseudooceanicola batsensis HTCC2597]|uniref:Uncharacterized protein n=1 Tax=Pseudooceanicola batsensis (strain ATCC BAA-863 / DSM 15984 / KCTC 12145 / HTCC2597) TaxID=252305 RepID=A3TX12_PSEBH|nr:hypothetical protein [Pseudooceanicola batsensis]EAQ03372.1 hypothetical protein OB2597_02092 [Pseudooceanicola batsensis HTCC2597]